jgi:hypothetical protein
MNGLTNVVLGVCGGFLGSVFKLWLDDKWNERKARLRPRELELIKYIKQERGIAKFRCFRGSPPIFKSSEEDMNQPGFNFQFTDQGETERLIGLGYIEELDRDELTHGSIIYRLTGKGWIQQTE